jgi:hypothetical protein
MKSMFETVDVSRAGFRPPMYALEHLDYEASLRTALVAALGVIDAFDDYAESLDLAGAVEKIDAARTELEAALKVFRKEGIENESSF